LGIRKNREKIRKTKNWQQDSFSLPIPRIFYYIILTTTTKLYMYKKGEENYEKIT
jgi:hypothetical protein